MGNEQSIVGHRRVDEDATPYVFTNKYTYNASYAIWHKMPLNAQCLVNLHGIWTAEWSWTDLSFY